MSDKYNISAHDTEILRKLSADYMEVANSERNLKNIARFYAMDEGEHQDRPAIIVENVIDEKRRETDLKLLTENDFARGIEFGLRLKISDFNAVYDDNPLDPYFDIRPYTSSTGYGLDEQKTKPTDREGTNGAYHIDPVIKDIEKDFPKLQHREFTSHIDESEQQLIACDKAFGDILKPRFRGYYYWTLGLTNTVINFIGLEELMLYMYEEPEGLHKVMDFFCTDFLNHISWLEENNLYTPNNEGDYTGSGSRGYTKKLPKSTDGKIRTSDLWCLIESQETVGVGPDKYAEFIYPYEAKIAERFGMVYYGCCEPVHTRWEILKNMPNLKRISVSPWCDEEFMGKACKESNIVYSRKPNPTLVSTQHFDEKAIADDIRLTAEVIKKNAIAGEIIMKDVHTVNGEYDRLDRWARMAEKVFGEVF